MGTEGLIGCSAGFNYGVLLMGMPVFVAPSVGIRESSRPTHAEVGFCAVVIDCKHSSMHTVECHLTGSSCLFFRLNYYGLEQKEQSITLDGITCT